MKKKLLLAGAVALMAAAAGTGISANSKSNVSELLNANVEALAGTESGGGMANACCPIWTVSVTTSWTGTSVTCTTGGSYKCNNCKC